MTQAPEPALLISSTHLKTVAELITMRFPLRVAESKRVSRLRALLNSAAELNRTLAVYSQHALVHCHGTAGTSDLTADTSALDRALRNFGAEIEAVALEYDDAVNTERVSPYDEPPEPPRRRRDFMPWQSPVEGMASF